MRTIILALLIPLAACGNSRSSHDATGGAAGTGTGDMRSFAVTEFTAIDQRGPDGVDVRVGSGFSVRAEGDPKVLQKLRIERVGDTLRIGRVRSSGFSWGSNGAATIYVTMPRVTSVSLAGSGDVAVDRVEGGAFDGDIAGSGTLTLGAVAVDSMKLTIAGSGNVAARGEVGTLRASIAGSGDIAGDKLTARGADVRIAGSGSIKAAVDGEATVSLMGSGDVDLGPGSRCRTRKSGSGEVRCGG